MNCHNEPAEVQGTILQPSRQDGHRGKKKELVSYSTNKSDTTGISEVSSNLPGKTYRERWGRTKRNNTRRTERNRKLQANGQEIGRSVLHDFLWVIIQVQLGQVFENFPLLFTGF